MDVNAYNIEELQRKNKPKVDSRNTIEHTFTTTNPETFRHGFNRTPQGATVIKRSKMSNIYLLNATKTDVTMQSSVTSVSATILLI